MKTIAGLIRAALALLFCFAALMVFARMAEINGWGGFQLRAPIFLLAPWAYGLAPRRRVVSGLWALSLICIFGAWLTLVLPVAPALSDPRVLNGLGAVGFGALGAALVIHAWQVLRDWRADRARLRANSRGRLERVSGGF